ncbi:MAG TPA: class II fumarate hydratase [Actinomycetota bacterium]|nr:class II fumarate hydratase [Actinomycetota bacterium]
MVSEYRTEKDSMGEVRVPAHAYWGASTQRAVDNFPVSGQRFPRRFIEALGQIKWAAAAANAELGLLEAKTAEAIKAACDEVIAGTLDEHFVLDIFQTGSGTSTNMNANEVIANRASEIAGGDRGSKLVHPNDHVNNGQSSNDVIPTAIHVSALAGITFDLIPALERLRGALDAKAGAWTGDIKAGRTHLMDATPITFGQEFSGYAMQIRRGIERLQDASKRLAELALGGTAVGTGINADERFAARAVAILADRTGLPLREAENHFEAQGAKDAAVETSGMLRTIAASLMKIANDIRWMGSGPRAGLGELKLPELQPGSSIMPGKVNPVIPEVVTQVAAQVIGNDAAIVAGGMQGHFELNVFMPMIARNMLESIQLLSAASGLFVDKCIDGLEPDRERALHLAEQTFPIVTALVPAIGYDLSAEISKEAFKTGKSIREVALERGALPEKELDEALDLMKMTRGGIVAPGLGGG